MSHAARRRSTCRSRSPLTPVSFLGIWDHLTYLEQQERVIDIHELRERRNRRDQRRAHPSAQARAGLRLCLSCFEDGDKWLLVVMDEITGWEPPEEAKGVDLAIVPMGIHEFHPLTGERRIPKEHPVFDTGDEAMHEATFPETLDIVKKLNAESRRNDAYRGDGMELSYDQISSSSASGFQGDRS